MSAHKKNNTYDTILVIINWLIKKIFYQPVKVTFDALQFAKVILNIIIRQHDLSHQIFINKASLFTSKFLFLFYYFFCIKQRLSVVFHPKTDGQTQC